MKTGDDIEKLFKDRFQDAEVNPSQDIWAKLEAKIENNGVESLYQTAFKNAEVRPAASVWKKISSILALRAFLTFKCSTFNIYYASIISAILGVTAFQISQKFDGNTTKSVSHIAQNAQNVEETSKSGAVSPLKTKESEPAQISHNIEAQSIAQSEKTATQTVYTHDQNLTVGNNSLNSKKEQSSAPVDWSGVKIVGNNSICQDVPSVYGVQGLTTYAEIKWILPKSAKKNTLSGYNVSISWQESGSQNISAIIKIGGEKKQFDYPVVVDGVEVPIIKGKTKVCQGTEKQLYYVDENINKEISYLWETQQNTIDQIGNKFINIDWTNSGKDTLSVVKVNTKTGCKSSATMAIVVYPQPKIDFEVYPLSETEYQFVFCETQRKGYSYLWNIENMQYAEPTVTHEVTGMDNSFVTLSVTDRNGCLASIQKDIDFNRNFIAVPQKFTPISGKYFMPMTNGDLQSYKIEIYNARNEKIWESTDLQNGKPAVGWDGKFRGADLPRGKYMWKISATFNDGTQWKGITHPNGSCTPNGIFILED